MKACKFQNVVTTVGKMQMEKEKTGIRHGAIPVLGGLLQRDDFSSRRMNSRWNNFRVQHVRMLHHQAALTIQAFYRGYRVRRDLHSEISPGPRRYTARVTKGKRIDYGHVAKSYGANMIEKNDHTCQNSWEYPVENHYQYGTAYRRSPPNGYLDKHPHSDYENPASCLTQSHPKKAGQIPGIKDRSYWERYPYIDARMENHAATIIQSAYRGFVVRRLFLELKFAATVIQAFWRGYAARKKLDLMDHSAGLSRAHCLAWTSQEHHKSPEYSYDHAKTPHKLGGVMTTLRKCVTPKVSNQEVAFSKTRKQEGLQLQDPDLGRPVYCYWPDNEDKGGKGRDIANLQITITQTEHPTDHLMNRLECTNQDSFLQSDTWHGAKPPCEEYVIRRRKSREQLRKEHISAATIQSAWKAYLVRKEIKEMNKAATRIQAFYRGFKVRQELQLDNDTTVYHGFTAENTQQKALHMLLHTKGRVEPHGIDTLRAYPYQRRPTFKVQARRGRMVAADKTFSENSLSTNFEHRSTQTQGAENQCFCRPRNMTVSTSKSVSGKANHLFESRRPPHGRYSAARNHPSRNGYFVSKQIREMHEAATRIQAFYRGYKTRLVLQETGLLRFGRLGEAAGDAITYPMAHSNEREMPLARREGACGRCRMNPAKDCTAYLAPESPIRNINVSRVVRDGQYFQRPPISIRVSSTNGIVYGCCNGTTKGAEGHYMIKTSAMRPPSKILVNVNMVNMK
ncbi:IQ domain-containing protein N [Lissotriton helveticus]